MAVVAKITKSKKRRPGERGKGRKTGDHKVSPEQMVDAAIDLFSTQGFASTSIQNIADQLGVSQSAVLYHFPSRTKLFLGCVKLIQERNRASVELAMKPEDDALSRLRKHFSANLMWAVKAPAEAQVILILYYLAAFDPEFAALNVAMVHHARDKIRVFILAAQRERIFRDDIDTYQWAETFHDSLLAGIVVWLATRIHAKEKQESFKRLSVKWEALFSLVRVP